MYSSTRLIVITWEINAEPKLGPCPEKWLPLLPANVNDYAFLQKCISHIDVTSLKPKVEKFDDAKNACSHMFGNSSNAATIFLPDDERELKNFLTFAGKEALEGMINIIVKEKILYDHSDNVLQGLGRAIVNAAINATDKHCAWNVQKYRTSARNARDICREKRAQLVTIDNIAEWSYITRLASTLAPKAKDRSLLLGYTRCSTDPPEWRTMEGGISPQFVPFPDPTKIDDEKCCLELNIENKINYEAIKMQKEAFEGAELQAVLCNKKVNYFICKKTEGSK
ncbi:unnamed protein product [Acanthocheilonema viteae]|uniref:C-type lectin domain-containing protein n=1 Tax=Acanthocheilonema viteae TaxID=6277 RepID=A0A498RX91_ACAVI|nr:unnamed protein product [Acanthocheilonema viteae]